MNALTCLCLAVYIKASVGLKTENPAILLPDGQRARFVPILLCLLSLQTNWRLKSYEPGLQSLFLPEHSCRVTGFSDVREDSQDRFI